MDRRDFLAAWIQALLLAIFPFLRARPLEQSLAVAFALVDKMPEGITTEKWGWWVNHAAWSMARGYDLRWQIGQNEEALDELLSRTQCVPTSTL